MEGICVSFLDQVQFFRYLQGTLPWQPILCGTGLVRLEPKYLRIGWTDFHNLFHHMVGIELQMISTSFFQYLKGRCHGNQFVAKLYCTYRSVIPKRNGISPCKYIYLCPLIAVHRVKMVKIGWVVVELKWDRKWKLFCDSAKIGLYRRISEQLLNQSLPPFPHW